MPYYTFTISWPPRCITPNGTGKLRDKMRAKKAYREEAWAQALAAGLTGAEKAHIHFTFHPDKRGRMPDMDNCIGSMKHAQDGICLAMKMDDGDITASYAMSRDRRRCVVINVSTDMQADTPLKGVIS